MSLTRFRSNLYQRERENRGRSRRREKRPAARAQKNERTTNRRREGTREREKEAVVVIVSKVEGLKSYHFFVVYLCVCFCGETSSWFFYMSLSINTRVQLLLVLLYYYYYSIILQIYNSFNHSSRWTLAYSSTTGIPFTNGWFNKTEYHPSNGAAPKEETQKHECEAGSKFSHLDWSVK